MSTKYKQKIFREGRSAGISVMYMWRHIVLYGMLDVIEKILPPVECIEESQTIPIFNFIIPFEEYTN